MNDAIVPGMRTTAEAVHAQPTRAAAISLLHSLDLPTADLTDRHMEHFFYCGRPEAPEALVGLEFFGANALLRSLAVIPARRSGGLGTALVEHAEAYARELGARRMYLLTTTAEAFFRRRGYVAAEREKAPAEIRASREFADLCPAGSALLFKRL